MNLKIPDNHKRIALRKVLYKTIFIVHAVYATNSIVLDIGLLNEFQRTI